MKKIGYSTLVASMTAVEISILFSFVASMLVTWGDRFDGFTLEQRLKITPRLLLLFNLFHPALYMMGGGIPFVERTLSVPFYAAWAICQILTVTISFIGADRVIFGKIITVVKKTE
jgi:putative flippase GtrA